MARIYITCPDCTADTPMQARVMLATLGEFLGPLGRCSVIPRRSSGSRIHMRSAPNAKATSQCPSVWPMIVALPGT